MLKVLYAAGNSYSSRVQLSRFLKYQGNYELKIAAYNKSSPKGINIDWTLDPLLNMKKNIMFMADNLVNKIYYNQIKDYNPDLIISDTEIYTSYIGNLLDIRVIQCSSNIIRSAIVTSELLNAGMVSKYKFIAQDSLYSKLKKNLIANSSRNYLYSHFGDLVNPPAIGENFEWVRPYHKVGLENLAAKHNIVSATINSNKKIINILNDHEDCISFSEFTLENFKNVIIKDLNNEEEYYSNIRNCSLVLSEGITSFMADAYYNEKLSAILHDFESEDSLINGLISNALGLSKSIYDLKTMPNKQLVTNYNNISYLHEKVDELLGLK